MPRVSKDILRFFTVQRPIREEECYILDVLSKTNTIHVMCISDSGRIRYLIAPSSSDIKEMYKKFVAKGKAPKIKPEVVGGRIVSYTPSGERDLVDLYTWLAELVEAKKLDVEPGLKVYNVRDGTIRISPKGLILKLSGSVRRDVLCSKSLANVELVHGRLEEEKVGEARFSGVVITSRETYVGVERELVRAFIPMSIEPISREEATIVDVDASASSGYIEETTEVVTANRRDLATKAIDRIQQIYGSGAPSASVSGPQQPAFGDEDLEKELAEADKVLDEEMKREQQERMQQQQRSQQLQRVEERKSGDRADEFVAEGLKDFDF